MCFFPYLFERKQNTSKIYPEDHNKNTVKILRDMQKINDGEYKKCYRPIVVKNST